MIDAMFLALNFSLNFPKKELCSKVKNLDSTKNGKASEESHRASNHTQLGHQSHLKGQTTLNICDTFSVLTTFTSFSTWSKVEVSKKMCTTCNSKLFFSAETKNENFTFSLV